MEKSKRSSKKDERFQVEEFYQRDSLQVEQVIVYWSTIANKEAVKTGRRGNHGNFAGTKPYRLIEILIGASRRASGNLPSFA